jgi:hypothetical protein
MRRLTWLAGPLFLLAGCGEAPAEAPLPTYTGELDDDEAFYVRGTLELHEGCLAVAVKAGDETVRAMLRLPADSGADMAWEDDRLWYHHTPYDLGSALVFRATIADGADVDDIPAVCRDTGLEKVLSAVPEASDLALDPGATVIGTGDQLRVPVAELTNAGMDAALRADLAVVGGHCLGVEGHGLADTVLIWPFGTTVSYDPDPVVRLPDGTTYAVGDRLDLGGGEITTAPVDGLPPECQALDRWLVSPF